MKKKIKVSLLKISGAIVSILPAIVFIICNWYKYTATKSDTTFLAIGGAMSIAMVIVKAMGKFKGLNPAITCLALDGIVYFLQNLLQDIGYVLIMIAIGQFINHEVFGRIIKKIESDIIVDRASKEAELIAENTVKKYLGRV